MNPSARRARRILRTARRGPWGNGRNALTNAMQPVYATDGTILHYRLVEDPWYTNRNGWFRPRTGTSLKTKAGQEWIRATRKSARWDAYHATSDCCGWGNGEYAHGPYEYVGTTVVPTRSRLKTFKEKE